MHKQTIFAIGAIAIAGCAAHAQSSPADAPRFLSADEVVAARQTSMRLTAMNMKAMKEVIDNDADPKTMGFAAGAMERWGRSLPTLFPVTLVNDKAKVTAALASERAGFDTIAASFASNTARLTFAARSSDRAGFASAWSAVRADCDSCHEPYRVE